MRPRHPRCAAQITKLARKGLTPSQIGVLLRDQSGVPQVASITGKAGRMTGLRIILWRCWGPVGSAVHGILRRI